VKECPASVTKCCLTAALDIMGSKLHVQAFKLLKLDPGPVRLCIPRSVLHHAITRLTSSSNLSASSCLLSYSVWGLVSGGNKQGHWKCTSCLHLDNSFRKYLCLRRPYRATVLASVVMSAVSKPVSISGNVCGE